MCTLCLVSFYFVVMYECIVYVVCNLCLVAVSKVMVFVYYLSKCILCVRIIFRTKLLCV